MEIILNLFKVILPAITTGLFTFFITKYTYNRNRPIDKIEIAYDRIYYPLFRIISDECNNNDINNVIHRLPFRISLGQLFQHSPAPPKADTSDRIAW